MNRPKQILLVEDSPRDAALILDVLALCNLSQSVVHVSDGRAALDYLHRRGQYAHRTGPLPDAVILDLNIPRVNGFDVLNDMKGTPSLEDIDVVIMTSSAREQARAQSGLSGAKAFIIKPNGFVEFLDKVRQLGFFWSLQHRPAAINPPSES